MSGQDQRDAPRSFEQWLRRVDRRLLALERRAPAPLDSTIVVSDPATLVADWNSDQAILPGTVYAAVGAANAPTDTDAFIGYIYVTSDVAGLQVAFVYFDDSTHDWYTRQFTSGATVSFGDWEPMMGSGGGGVTSVNGDTGPAVVLDASDVGAATPADVTSGDAATLAAAEAYTDAHAGALPTGGTTGQALIKQSATDGDADWETLTASDVGAADTAYVDAGDAATLASAESYADSHGPVTSVNTQTGAVVLDASDVGALDDGTTLDAIPIAVAAVDLGSHELIHVTDGTSSDSAASVAQVTLGDRNGKIPLWVGPGTAYLVDQVVWNNSIIYRCNTAHTSSATFNLDALKWSVVTTTPVAHHGSHEAGGADAVQHGAWQTVSSFSNSWVAVSGDTVQYRLEVGSNVRLSGRVTSGTSGQNAFTLPSGFRSAIRNDIAVATDITGTVGSVQVKSGGGIQINLPSGATWVSLCGVVFSTT